VLVHSFDVERLQALGLGVVGMAVFGLLGHGGSDDTIPAGNLVAARAGVRAVPR